MQKANALQVFTIVARNYLPYALVLGDSVLQYHPDATFSIFLMDDLDHSLRSSIEARGFQPIFPEEIPLTEYRKLAFQYNITEASTGVKPSVIQMLFDSGAKKVIYLDPDILCFRRFDEVLAALDGCCIVLTPHICSPVPDDYYPGERALLNSGAFNLGFIALRASETSTRFLRWWAEHLRRECVQEIESGLFVDQKWIDMVPACFDHVYIMRNLAYNIAYWNLHERALEEREGKLYEVQSGDRVAFIHFSGIVLDDLNSLCKYTARNPFGDGSCKQRYTLSSRPDLAATFMRYKQLLLAADFESFSRLSYAYAAYDDGEPISDLERSLYRTSESWRSKEVDPFRTGGGSFRDACRRAGVRTGMVRPIKRPPEVSHGKNRGYRRLIEFFLRCCLLVLGPQNYLQFAKYMRHQFLPSNHGFLLTDENQTSSGDSAELANLTPRYTPVLPNPSKIEKSL